MGNKPDQEETIYRIYKTALANINETAWAKAKRRQAKRNNNVCFLEDEYKCNLFVYEVILAAGFSVGTPNAAINPIKYGELLIQWKFARPPTTHEWYRNENHHFKFVGEGYDGLKKLNNGDILTDDTHMGIAAYNDNEKRWTTISAGEFKVNQNYWGIDWTYNNKPVRIYRYCPGYIAYGEHPHVIW